MVGDKSGIDWQFWGYLRDSGLLHVVVVSGSNVILLGGVVIENLAGLLGRKLAIVTGLLILWGYVGLVGWEIPVLRSMLLLLIYYWAQFWGRKFDLLRGLGLAVGIMLLVDITMVREVSFWLSLVAFVAVVVRQEGMNLRWYGGNWWRMFSNDFLMALWVGIWVMPVLAISFGKVSVVGPVVAGLVLGVVEVVTLVGGIGAVVGMVVPVVGKIMMWLIWPLLKYFVVMAEAFSSFSGLEIRFNWVMLVGYYLVLLWWVIKKGGWTSFGREYEN